MARRSGEFTLLRPVFWAAFAALLLVQCLPFLLTVTPPLLDYPNHLARVFILGHWKSDLFLREYYQPSWAPLPNLAFDGIGVVLNMVLPIYLTGRVVLLAAVVLLASGLVALSTVLHGRAKPFCLLGFLFIFSEPFAWGFVNLILGFGLVLWGVAVWLRLRNRPASFVVAWSVPFAMLLFFVHLFAFASYAVAILCIELTMARSATRSPAAQVRAALAWTMQFVVPAAVFLFGSPTPLSSGTTHYGSLLDRLRSLPLAPVRNFNDTLDMLTVVVVAALLGAGLWTRRLQIAQEMRLALVVLALLCLAIPHSISTSETAEIRLPVITLLLLAASGHWLGRRKTPVLAGALLLALLFVTRTVVTMEAFAQGARFVAEMKQALTGVPRGARIASVTVTTPSAYRIAAAWQHSICYEVIDKSALVPSVFAFPGQQPLLLGPKFRDQVFPPVHYVSRPDQVLPASRFAQVDYVVIVNPRALQTELPSNLQLVTTSEQFRVYRVRARLPSS